MIKYYNFPPRSNWQKKKKVKKIFPLRRCDSPVPLKPSCVPDLGLDDEAIELHCPSTELHTDSCATVVVKLIFGETRQQVTLSHSRLSNQDHCIEEAKKTKTDLVVLVLSCIRWNHRTFFQTAMLNMMFLILMWLFLSGLKSAADYKTWDPLKSTTPWRQIC